MPDDLVAAEVDVDEEIVDKLQSRLKSHVEARTAKAIDPAVIIAIIAAVMQLLQNCPRPSVRQLKRGGLLVQARLYSALSTELPEANRDELYGYTKDALQVAKDSSDDEVVQFVSVCTQ